MPTTSRLTKRQLRAYFQNEMRLLVEAFEMPVVLSVEESAELASLKAKLITRIGTPNKEPVKEAIDKVDKRMR